MPDLAREPGTSVVSVSSSEAELVPWWDDWPRFTNGTNLEDVTAWGASVSNASTDSGLADEGRGPLLREHIMAERKGGRDAMANSGIRLVVWIEGQGETRNIICAVERLPSGAYRKDERTNQTKIIEHHWTWHRLSITSQTEVHWASVASFVNEEAWLGSLIRSHPIYGVPVPRYPDGRDARGYSDNDDSDPRNARLYDAMASKNLLSGFNERFPSFNDNIDDSNSNGMLRIQEGVRTKYTGDVHFGKDMASPWWLEYSRSAVRFFLRNKVDGFWVDNYSGWDFISRFPVYRAFGEWSVATFRDFLFQHPEVGITNLSGFDIREHLLEKFTELGLTGDPRNLDNPGWKDMKWTEDPVWRAFLVHKGRIAGERARELRRIVKEEANNSGNYPNPEDVGVFGNDIPKLTFGGFTGEEVDMVVTEYSPGFQSDVGNNGRGLPPRGRTGPFYELATRYGKSRHAVVWYYLDGPHFEKYRENPNLGEVLGFEALAHNALLTGGPSEKLAGNASSSKKVNDFIARMAPIFRRRRRRAAVGLVFSVQTQYSTLAPGGEINFDHTHAFYGWGAALEDLRIPYRVIPDFRLVSETLDSYSVLILPHVRSIEFETVERILVPFLRSGGALIITGGDSGSIRTVEGLFERNQLFLLAALGSRVVTPGRVIFIPAKILASITTEIWRHASVANGRLKTHWNS